MRQRVILITGCSTGIGRYCAEALHKDRQWRVFASARQSSDVQALRDAGLPDALQLDLDSSESIQAAMAELLHKTDGRLDALFNNGAYGQTGAVEDLSRDTLRAQFESNVFGTQELTNAAIAVMRKNGGGRIVQNSSVLGFVCLKYRGAYNASKYALEALSDTMRMELLGSGIDIVLIEPGPITSSFRRNAIIQFERRIDAAASVHHQTYLAMQKAWAKNSAMPFALGPEAVYRALLRALNKKSPKLRERVTMPTKVFWLLKRILPASLLDKILRRIQ